MNLKINKNIISVGMFAAAIGLAQISVPEIKLNNQQQIVYQVLLIIINFTTFIYGFNYFLNFEEGLSSQLSPLRNYRFFVTLSLILISIIIFPKMFPLVLSNFYV